MQVNKFHREEFDKEHNVEYEHSIKLDSLMEFLPNPKAVLQKDSSNVYHKCYLSNYA